MRGDFVEKWCKDAFEQVEWLRLANEPPGFVRGVGSPKASLCEEDHKYRMEFIEGHAAWQDPTLRSVRGLLAQVFVWRDRGPASHSSWDSYLARLEDHVRVGDSEPMRLALSYVLSRPGLQTSFCHGDLTLENAIVRNGTSELIIIDPNYKPGLFQSYSLDLGKLLQSTHANYHSIFGQSDTNLSRQDTWLQKQLKSKGMWDDAYTALVSHVMRFRKYRQPSEHQIVDDLLLQLIHS